MNGKLPDLSSFLLREGMASVPFEEHMQKEAILETESEPSPVT